MDALRTHFGSLCWSLALHVVVVVLLAVGVDFRRAPQAPQVLAIEAMIVDEALLARVDNDRLEQARLQQEAEQRARDEEARRVSEAAEQAAAAERQREQALEQERVAAAAREREEAARQAEAEAARQAEVQRQQEAAARAEREAAERAERERQAEEARRAQEEAERQRQAEEARRRAEEEAQRQREEAARRAREEADRRRQAELDAQLQAAIAEEEARRSAVQSGQQDQYITLIRSRIQQNWIRPPSARVGIECEVQVVQIPSGEVVSVQVTRCNGDDAVVRSIEAAVRRSSPLPLPPNPALFQRNLNLTFVPDR